MYQDREERWIGEEYIVGNTQGVDCSGIRSHQHWSFYDQRTNSSLYCINIFKIQNEYGDASSPPRMFKVACPSCLPAAAAGEKP